MLRSEHTAGVYVVAAVTVDVEVEGGLISTMVSVSSPCSGLTGTDGVSACLVIAEDNTEGDGRYDCTSTTARLW